MDQFKNYLNLNTVGTILLIPGVFLVYQLYTLGVYGSNKTALLVRIFDPLILGIMAFIIGIISLNKPPHRISSFITGILLLSVYSLPMTIGILIMKMWKSDVLLNNWSSLFQSPWIILLILYTCGISYSLYTIYLVKKQSKKSFFAPMFSLACLLLSALPALFAMLIPT